MNHKAQLQRLKNAPKLCYSDILDCKINLDTGAVVNLVPSSLLSRFREKGLVMESIETTSVLNFADGSTKVNDKCWKITLPLSSDHWYRGYFFETSGDYLVLGQPYLKTIVVSYSRDKVTILEEQPKEFDLLVPLTEKDGRYFVKLSVNSREHDFYLDTGHADAISLPMEDKQYAISPIHEIEDDLRFHGMTKHIIDYEEERGLVEIQGITRHGPVVYADYYKMPYWFNPAIIFGEFMLDLKNKVIGFVMNKH